MILVVGGAGFIGSHLVDGLRGHRRPVRVLDALAARPGDSGGRLHSRVRKWAGGVEFIHGSVQDADVVRRALVGVDQVFHLGHRTGSRVSVGEPLAALENNVLGTQVLLSGMEDAGIKSFVLVSSGVIYGDSGAMPSLETDLPAPKSPFAASCVAMEALAGAWQATTGGSVCVVRPFTTYGPRMRPDSAIYRFLDACKTGREATMFGRGGSRDFVFVGDVIRTLLEVRRVRSEKYPATFNVASGQSTSLVSLLRLIERATGQRPTVSMAAAQPGDVASTWGSPRWTSDQLGVTARTSLEAGLESTWDWHQRLTR